MRVLAIAAIAFLAIAPAYAQGGLDFGDGKKKAEDKKLDAARQVEQDRAYKSSLQRIPAKDAVIDPWGSARETEANTSVQNRPKKPQAAKPAQ